LSLQLKSLTIVINTQIGTINDTKIKVLKDKLGSERFPLIGRQEGAPIVLMTNPNTREALVLAPNLIQVNIEGDNVNPQFEKIENDLKKISEILMLDNKLPYTLRVAAHYPAESPNAFDQSLAFVRDNITDDFPELKGIGLRFLWEQDQNIWEFKLEPFINDGKYFFIEFLGGSKEGASIEDIIRIAIDMIKKMSDKFLRICEIHFINLPIKA
jgi:hypothetical protein